MRASLAGRGGGASGWCAAGYGLRQPSAALGYGRWRRGAERRRAWTRGRQGSPGAPGSAPRRWRGSPKAAEGCRSPNCRPGAIPARFSRVCVQVPHAQRRPRFPVCPVEGVDEDWRRVTADKAGGNNIGPFEVGQTITVATEWGTRATSPK